VTRRGALARRVAARPVSVAVAGRNGKGGPDDLSGPPFVFF